MQTQDSCVSHTAHIPQNFSFTPPAAAAHLICMQCRPQKLISVILLIRCCCFFFKHKVQTEEIIRIVSQFKVNRRIAIANGTCVSFCYQPKAHFGLPGCAPGTIAVNVTWMKRGFMTCRTHRSIYPSIFNRFPVIQPVISKVHQFSTFWPPCVHPWDNRGKCYMDRKRIQCSKYWNSSSILTWSPRTRTCKLVLEDKDFPWWLSKNRVTVKNGLLTR